MHLVTWSEFLGRPVRCQELDSMILVGPFQLGIFYDSVIPQAGDQTASLMLGVIPREFLVVVTNTLFVLTLLQPVSTTLPPTAVQPQRSLFSVCPTA